MPACYVIPGLLGTTLGTRMDGTAPVWVDYTQLALGQEGKMRLAGDGREPGPPDGVQLYAGAPLADYYGDCVRLLGEQLGPHGYDVRQWGYDWRMRTRSQGALLAAELRTAATSAEPSTLIGHSLGGLVCRAAWADLASTGDGNKVRRIIALGSPHYGSYAAARLFCLDQAGLQQLAYLSAVSLFLAASVLPPLNARSWSRLDLLQLAATWPTLYELLPTLGAPDQVDDPERAALYDAAAWPSNRGLAADLLVESRSSFARWLLSPATMPPDWVMTCVAGQGLATPSALLFPRLLGSPASIGSPIDGDGTVTTVSALGPPSARYYFSAAHADLPWLTASSGLLAALVLDPRSGPLPPPPTVHDDRPLVLGRAGPPVAQWLWPDP